MNQKEFAEQNQICGCGKPVRYQVADGQMACNKYRRCPTYDELLKVLVSANLLLQAYRSKREVDGLNGRTWHASRHLEAEELIEKLENKT